VNLDANQLGQVHRALLQSFDRDELRMMLRLQLDEDLDAVAGDDELKKVVFNLITWAERSGRLDDLIAGALAANPQSEELQRLTADFARWQAIQPAFQPAPAPLMDNATTPPVPAQLAGSSRRNVALLVAGIALLAVLGFLLWRLVSPPAPIDPVPIDPTLPAEVLPTETPTDAQQPQPPRAPTLKVDGGYTSFSEESRIFTVESGGSLDLDMRDLWSAPEGTPVSCANGVIVASWQVRQPYPGGDDLEIRRVIPQGGGESESVITGARGRITASYCGTLILRNLDIADYRVEWRYVSAVQN
jgi:hypothetical protein